MIPEDPTIAAAERGCERGALDHEFETDILPRGGAERIFSGRTGAGMEVVIDEVDGWLDVRFLDTAETIHGFSLNPIYTVKATSALVGSIGRRASAPASHRHQWGDWQDDVAGSVRECASCAAIDLRPEG